MACSLLQSLKKLLKDTVLTMGELRRRKDQTDRFESYLLIDHGAALQLHNIERFRAINLVPVR